MISSWPGFILCGAIQKTNPPLQERIVLVKGEFHLASVYHNGTPLPNVILWGFRQTPALLLFHQMTGM